MKERLNNVIAYLLARLNEGSTIRGLILILTAVGVKVDPQLAEAIVTGGLMLAGLIGILFPDQLRKGKALKTQVDESAQG
jgi:hypothetical protein